VGGSLIDVPEPHDCFQEGALRPGWPSPQPREIPAILPDISGKVSHDCIIPPPDPTTKSGSRFVLICRRQGLRTATALVPLSAGACCTGFVILTAKPIAGHDAKGQRREPRPGRSRCRRRPGPGSGPETGASPGSSACPAPGRRPCPRTPRQSRPPRPRPPRRSSKRLSETSVSLPGITLSNEGGRGERARIRRYDRLRGLTAPAIYCTQSRMLCMPVCGRDAKYPAERVERPFGPDPGLLGHSPSLADRNRTTRRARLAGTSISSSQKSMFPRNPAVCLQDQRAQARPNPGMVEPDGSGCGR
jgi:hypothetical protein